MSVSDKTLQQIKEARERLLLAADALQAVADNNSTVTDAGRACGMTGSHVGQDMRTLLMKGFVPYIKTQMKSIDGLARALEDLRSPGDNLLLLMFGEDSMNEPHQKDTVTLLPGYDEDRLWALTEERLTPRELFVIRCVTGKETGRRMSYQEVAKEVSLTVNRIGQIRNKALRKMRHPRIVDAIFPAMTVRKSAAFERIRTKHQKASIEHAKVFSLIRETDILERATKQLQKEMNLSEEETELISKEPGAPVPIDEIRISSTTPISVRAYNCLKRANIKTLNEVAVMPVDDIMRIRNLGRRSVQELQAAILYHFGLDREDMNL